MYIRPADLRSAVSAALAHPVRTRLQPIDLPGGRVWLKRAEHLPLRMRLQKGDPRRSLEAERQGLHLLARAGLPVPDLLAEGPDWLVLPDIGQDLARIARESGTARRRAVFSAAGVALARLHDAGFAHGRPALRDLCWDGAAVRFIDLERFRPGVAPIRRRAFDLIVFAQAWFSLLPDRRDGLDAAMTAYRAAVTVDTLVAAQRLARRLGWLATAASAARRLRPGSRELRAVPLTLAYMAAGG